MTLYHALTTIGHSNDAVQFVVLTGKQHKADHLSKISRGTDSVHRRNGGGGAAG